MATDSKARSPIDVYPDQRVTCLDCNKYTWIRWNGTAYAADDPTWSYHVDPDDDRKSKLWHCGHLAHHTRMSGIRARAGFRLYSRNDADRTRDVADPTPGPWKLSALKNCSNGYPDSLAVVPETTGERRGPAICLLSPLDSVTMNDEANARLIAAAPELLNILKDVEWQGLEDDPDGGHYGACPACGGGDPDDSNTPEEYAGHTEDCTLAAAIAKAEGRTS